jgi:hypothetical protein
MGSSVMEKPKRLGVGNLSFEEWAKRYDDLKAKVELMRAEKDSGLMSEKEFVEKIRLLIIEALDDTGAKP